MRLRSLSIGIALSLLAAYGPAGASDAKQGTPKVVFQERSVYRNILVVEGGGYRCMKFGRFHAAQTCIQIANPSRMALSYTQALLTGLYINPKPRRALVLGLGGGVIPNALRTFDNTIEVDSVELDPAVVKVAQSHFGYREDAHSRAHVDDARVFVRKKRREGAVYDFIVIDAFDKDYIPEHLLTREFLNEVKSLLSTNGVVAANTYTDGALARHEAATYQAVFGDVFNVDTGSGNRIILACRDRLPALSAISETAKQLDPEFLALGASSGDLVPRIRALPKVTGVRLLTDKYSPSNLLLLSGNR